MTLLTSPHNAKTGAGTTYEHDLEDIQIGPKVKRAPAPAKRHVEAQTQATLLTLSERLEAQLEGDEDQDAPEVRAIRSSVRRRLAQVKAALLQIEQGTYGICTDCDRPVEADRLVIQPFSTRCTNCQTIADWKGLNY